MRPACPPSTEMSKNTLGFSMSGCCGEEVLPGGGPLGWRCCDEEVLPDGGALRWRCGLNHTRGLCRVVFKVRGEGAGSNAPAPGWTNRKAGTREAKTLNK